MIWWCKRYLLQRRTASKRTTAVRQSSPR